MRHTYASVKASQMYLTKNYSIELDDVVWVIEGDLKKPAHFRLADCFRYMFIKYPPFPAGSGKFKFKISSRHSLLAHEILIDKAAPWFSMLHSKYITKQKFFHSLDQEPLIVNGLRDVSGITL